MVQEMDKKMIDKKAEKWNKNNKWFGKNKSLTLLAIYFHENLVNINVNPETEKYYKIINLFMEPFVTGKVKLKSRPKQRNIVKLTKAQKEIAKKLDVPLIAYTANNWKSGIVTGKQIYNLVILFRFRIYIYIH